jgi:hypothetical protein
MIDVFNAENFIQKFHIEKENKETKIFIKIIIELYDNTNLRKN